jgi:sugar phosphate isomerase/epimerase
MTSTPKVSVCEFTTPDLTFEEDLALYTDLGFAGVGLCEVKLDAAREKEQLEAFKSSGLVATSCIPINLGVLTAEPMFPGPSDVEERIEAMCQSIRRLAPFSPDSVVVITGSPRDHDPATARKLVVEGLRKAAEVAADVGTRLALEPLRTDGGLDLTIVRTLQETLDLIDEIGAPNIDVAYDLYHMWDIPEILPLTEGNAGRIAAVHICDWREPPRSPGDRLVPGDGLIDIPAALSALERGGFDGWYDIEIFSDKDLEGSLWLWPPRDLVERSRDGFDAAWRARTQPAV